MYLEISGRQCGKTTRLIDFAVKQALKGKRVAIVGINHSHKTKLAQLVRERLDGVIINKNGYIQFAVKLVDTFSGHLGLMGRMRVYDWICYDEFDFNTWLSVKDIGKNTYFVTSPKSLRKVEDRKKSNKRDVLYQLILKKKGKYHSYINPDFDMPKYEPLDTYWQEKFGIWKLDKDGYVTLNGKVKSVWLKQK